MTPNLEERIVFRAEPGLRAALMQAAHRNGTSASEILRAAVRAVVQAGSSQPEARRG